jgi:hypothetical protein
VAAGMTSIQELRRVVAYALRTVAGRAPSRR